MKKWIIAGTLLVSGIAAATYGELVTFSRVATVASDAAPVQGVSTGLDLMNINGWRLSTCATSGNTLSGAGTFLAYVISENTGVIMRDPALDFAVTVTSTSCGGSPCRCQVFPDVQEVMQGGGQLYYQASGVTVSGGTTVTVNINAWRNKR
jgi:hypothetical protein